MTNAERFGWLTDPEQQRLNSIAYKSFWAAVSRIPTERGKSRDEYYCGSTRNKEQFGLNKRTRRMNRGIECSHPDGNFYDKQAQENQSTASAQSKGQDAKSEGRTLTQSASA